jgi:hypothetical protein
VGQRGCKRRALDLRGRCILQGACFTSTNVALLALLVQKRRARDFRGRCILQGACFTSTKVLALLCKSACSQYKSACSLVQKYLLPSTKVLAYEYKRANADVSRRIFKPNILLGLSTQPGKSQAYLLFKYKSTNALLVQTYKC